MITESRYTACVLRFTSKVLRKGEVRYSGADRAALAKSLKRETRLKNGEDELARLAARFNQMGEKLNQVESMRRRLIGDVSHELRTPLTAIKGLMDGVLPANKETYQQIHVETDRLNRLVDDLQELSRVESRAYELDIQSMDLPSLVSTVSKRLAPQAESKRISLDVDLFPDLPQVLADQERWQNHNPCTTI